MFVKITNGQVEKAPYTIGEFRKAHPNVSFPKDIPLETLANHGVYPIKQTNPPQIDYKTHTLSWTVTLVNNEWEQFWTANKLAEDVAANNVRTERDRLLTKSDWTQVADAPVDKQAWATHRQALRDIPSQVGFPWDVTWPEKPEE